MAIPATEAGILAWLDQALNLERAAQNPAGFREYRLDRMRAAMAHLPPPPAPVTVTGTKGKGSTLRLIEAGLRALGRPTVAFTSPHLASVRERWRIDGEPIPHAELAGHAAAVAAVETATGTALTWFERCFAIAVHAAAARPQADFLCEVGLGGRLDCANVLDARLVVLTHLSHDHCEVLGNTLELIAGEKLALCRPGRPVVIAPQSPEGERAVRAHAPATSPATWVRREASPIALALPGAHQQDNASTALAVLRLVAPGCDETCVRAGFAGARLAGRCQLVAHAGRRILVDGAHNDVSVAATIAVAHDLLRPGWRLVLGVAKDKAIDGILAAVPPAARPLRCGYASPRARLQADWPPAAQAWPWHADVAAALRALPDGDLCITGSLYVAGEALCALGVAGELPG